MDNQIFIEDLNSQDVESEAGNLDNKPEIRDFKEIIASHMGWLVSPIVKSNELIRDSKFALSLLESRIVNYMLVNLDYKTDEFTYLRFRTIDFCRACRFSKFNTSYLKETIHRLSAKSLQVKVQTYDKNNNLVGESYVPIKWLDDYEIDSKNGYIYLKFQDRLIPYFLNLKKNFTKFQFAFMISFTCKYSFQLYEFIRSYAFHCEKSDNGVYVLDEPVEKLKQRFCLGEKLDRFADFHRRVLIPAIKEINEYTDIVVDMNFVKYGKTVTNVLFKIHFKADNEIQKIVNEATQKIENVMTPIVLPKERERPKEGFLPSETYNEKEEDPAVLTTVVVANGVEGQIMLDI